MLIRRRDVGRSMNCELLIAVDKWITTRLNPLECLSPLTHIIGYFGCQFTGAWSIRFWAVLTADHGAIANNSNKVRQTRQKLQQHATGSSESRLEVEKLKSTALHRSVYVLVWYIMRHFQFRSDFPSSSLTGGTQWNSIKSKQLANVNKRPNQTKSKPKKPKKKWVRLEAGTHYRPPMTMSPMSVSCSCLHWEKTEKSQPSCSILTHTIHKHCFPSVYLSK